MWDNLELDEKCWVHDALHAPDPFSKSAQVIQGQYLADGFNKAFDTYGLKHRVHVKFFNDYYFMNIPLFQTHVNSPEEDKHILDSVQTYEQNWHDAWLPKIRAHHQAFDAYSYQSKAMLAQEFADFLERAQDLWFIHGLNFLPMFIAPHLFAEHCETLGLPQDVSPLEAVTNNDNQTLSMGAALFDFVQKVRSSTDNIKLFEASDSELILNSIIPGHDLFDALEAFSIKYGLRNGSYIDIAQPTWNENRVAIINLIKLFLSQDEVSRPSTIREHNKLKTRECLIEYQKRTDPEQLEKLEALIRIASFAFKIQEDHNYLIESRIIHQSRVFYLKIFDALQEKLGLNDVADLFDYFPEQIIALLNGQLSLAPVPVKRVAQCPPMLGIPPGPPQRTLLNKALLEFFGESFNNVQTSQVLQGNPSSRGEVKGRARVIAHLNDADALRTGEILVVKTAAPSWTPLFSIAAAVITETGGRMSHAGIVAREYQIPAVMGVTGVVNLIQTGDMIHVNGGTGEIKLMGNDA